MKQFIIYLLSMVPFFFATYSFGKPGSGTRFLDKDIIHIQPQQSQIVELRLLSSAKKLNYVIQTSDGLTGRLLDSPDYIQGKILNIPVELHTNKPGRFYVHLYVNTNEIDGEKSSVISRVVSSENDAPVPALSKAKQINKLHLLPSTETITTQ